ncbi:YdcF family protein [Rhodovulum adriaticum]|uniref:DUF218 domain-containing protein n=1 Tax=Rhodovulum adriaticum TaxID=35804 RepID=A0A4V2SLC2_RHOAD|nr:YdcF family protein [Rhodovulum adriaticum]MBK1636357.1 hypothetical protein [Rhodovulum adriaticum]TCP22846.1 DUF218 domain-containing protein [Rhodovulum adriaticum]
MAQAILILGAAMRPDGTPGPALVRRARHGAALWQARPGALIVASGAGGEAAAIAALCRGAGVPAERIVEEPAARRTVENIRHALPLLQARGVDEVILVTDDYHMPRARLLARRVGLRATASVPPRDPARSRPHRRLRMILREAAAYLATLLGLSGRHRP